MSENFAGCARRLAGSACRALGWRPGDFWSATPAELAAILDTGVADSDAPLSRREFEHLMEQDANG